ncbi:MAG: polyprenyl synthetase family protein [Clostridia bacterium]|nr:polyprenyl synthetase family protein [Clostridia bacterium]
MNKEQVAARVKHDAELIENALSDILTFSDDYSTELAEAMRYSVLGGGKRIRGVICLETALMRGASVDDAMPYACAVELMHASSLVHDDMPALDNDDMRRGKPSCHIKYGESTALLCGDALICLAFEALTRASADGRSAVLALAEAGGIGGICSGQVFDIASETVKPDYNGLVKIQTYKTGRLMRASAVLGCIASGDIFEDTAAYSPCAEYAEKLGLAFQIIDDILDADEEGSDKERGLATFLTFMSAEEAKNEAVKLSDEARSAIEEYENNGFLLGLCDYLLERTY